MELCRIWIQNTLKMIIVKNCRLDLHCQQKQAQDNISLELSFIRKGCSTLLGLQFSEKKFIQEKYFHLHVQEIQRCYQYCQKHTSFIFSLYSYFCFHFSPAQIVIDCTNEDNNAFQVKSQRTYYFQGKLAILQNLSLSISVYFHVISFPMDHLLNATSEISIILKYNIQKC